MTDIGNLDSQLTSLVIHWVTMGSVTYYRTRHANGVRPLVCTLVLLAAINATAALADGDGSSDVPDEGAGAIPLSPAEFAKLPKTPTYRAYLPERVDLSAKFPKPGTQGKIGSCTAWAVGYAARAYYSDAAEGRNLGDAANIPSPSYIYGAIIKDPKNCDSGSKIVDALELLRNHGAASLRSMAYSTKSCATPTPAQRAQQHDFKIAGWIAVDYTHVDQLKGELAKGHPVTISLRDTKSFQKLHGSDVYRVTDSPEVGFHAVTLLGYDEQKQAFRLINSWSPRWGDHGFGWIAYSAIGTEVREAYVMRPMAPVLDPPEPIAIVAKPPIPGPIKADLPSPAPDATILPGSCSKLSVLVSGMGGRGGARVSGFIDSKARLAQLQPKSDISQVQERPWPQCEVLQTLATELTQPNRPVVEVRAEHDLAKGGTLLKFTVKTPPYPSFLHVAYLQADGSVVNLVQPSSMALHAYPANSTVVLGDPATGGPTFHVAEPYGREMLVVTASRSPLFDTPLPDAQNARDFLTDLRAALVARPDQASPTRLVTAGFDSVITSAKGIVSMPPPSGF